MDFSRLYKGDLNSHSSSWHTRRCVTEQPTLIKSEWGYIAELYSSIDLDVIKREEEEKKIEIKFLPVMAVIADFF